MSSYHKLCSWSSAGILLGSLLSMSAVAQGPADLTDQEQTPNSPAPQETATADDDKWHFDITPYLWAAGLSGTVGALGREASVHVSPSDLISRFEGGLLLNVEARKNRLVLPLDLLWMKLEAHQALPFDDGLTGVRVGVSEVILTPKIGYRIVDQEKIKVDALVGFRYWYMRESLYFQPQRFNGFSTSQSWADGVAGAKITADLSKKLAVIIAGDAGGGGPSLDYQVAGALAFRV